MARWYGRDPVEGQRRHAARDTGLDGDPRRPASGALLLAHGRGSPPRLRADPRAAWSLVRAGDVAITARGRAAVVLESLPGADSVAAVAMTSSVSMIRGRASSRSSSAFGGGGWTRRRSAATSVRTCARSPQGRAHGEGSAGRAASVAVEASWSCAFSRSTRGDRAWRWRFVGPRRHVPCGQRCWHAPGADARELARTSRATTGAGLRSGRGSLGCEHGGRGAETASKR